MLSILDDEQCRTLLNTYWKQSLTGLALMTKEGRFVAVNPAFCQMTQFTSYELQNKKFPEITDPSDVVACQAMLKELFHQEIESFDMTKGYLTKTKECIPVLLRVTSLLTNEKFIFFVVQAAGVEKRKEQSVVPPKVRSNILNILKDNWMLIVAIGGAGLAVLDRVLNHFWKD